MKIIAVNIMLHFVLKKFLLKLKFIHLRALPDASI